MQPDEPTQEEQQEQTSPVQDSGTPFQPAAPNPDPTAATDPLTQAGSDSMLDDTHPAEESYDEGVSGAAEAQEPNAGNAVVDALPGAQPGQTITPASGPADSSDDDAGAAPEPPATTDGEQPPA